MPFPESLRSAADFPVLACAICDARKVELLPSPELGLVCAPCAPFLIAADRALLRADVAAGLIPDHPDYA